MPYSGLWAGLYLPLPIGPFEQLALLPWTKAPSAKDRNKAIGLGKEDDGLTA